MKKTSIIILLAMAMLLMVFTVACEGDSQDPSDENSRQLDTDDDVEAARGSDTTESFNFDNVTLDDWLELAQTDDASFRGSSIDMDNLVSASGN